MNLSDYKTHSRIVKLTLFVVVIVGSFMMRHVEHDQTVIYVRMSDTQAWIDDMRDIPGVQIQQQQRSVETDDKTVNSHRIPRHQRE